MKTILQLLLRAVEGILRPQVSLLRTLVALFPPPLLTGRHCLASGIPEKPLVLLPLVVVLLLLLVRPEVRRGRNKGREESATNERALVLVRAEKTAGIPRHTTPIINVKCSIFIAFALIDTKR